MVLLLQLTTAAHSQLWDAHTKGAPCGLLMKLKGQPNCFNLRLPSRGGMLYQWANVLPTQVHVKVCKRAGGKRDSLKQRFTLGAMFTHHQKTIVMDVDPARWSGQANRPLKSQGEVLKAALPRYLPGQRPLQGTRTGTTE